MMKCPVCGGIELQVGDIIKNHIGKMVVTEISGGFITVNGITRENTPSNFVKHYKKEKLIALDYRKDILSKRVVIG